MLQAAAELRGGEGNGLLEVLVEEVECLEDGSVECLVDGSVESLAGGSVEILEGGLQIFQLA